MKKYSLLICFIIMALWFDSCKTGVPAEPFSYHEYIYGTYYFGEFHKITRQTESSYVKNDTLFFDSQLEYKTRQNNFSSWQQGNIHYTAAFNPVNHYLYYKTKLEETAPQKKYFHYSEIDSSATDWSDYYLDDDTERYHDDDRED